ncbi:MAG: NAD(P)-dependent glycerol-1-phosphate dehydrogenase [Candidatus Poseidoniia archaeon]|nr:NAD(P)-dependent glycerol-1-phosphate dehydrogenase [Candidatus Poseidoniia archaeon]MDP6441631.1 NAD(P)-dependent glycerol-1-phosphate dehydrogenase [Candidatus Poseidoniia archaeon]MDP6592090.1 NAD(P)-dependent glycerol-1-phosphate dehydrogenase [Candidatus Poseidoniia archaeon]MDP7096426.1 NAD(P)-dependent glycerol-1-phosphate dehydrogenase [Candidatus Poseidoniia archaeon]MDP7665925.1 NAD(P)-dependent glycerol-1-phosphate dehydrogenase [Candidatus Poseidoniia archaeon]
MRSRPPRSMVLPRIVVTGPSVLEQLPAVIAELDLPERGLIVCDSNTLKIAGRQVNEYLEIGGHQMKKVVVEGANSQELLRVEDALDGMDFLVGVGGGRPIDLAKQAGFNKNIPFVSIPTAASHDGFGSARSSIRQAGRKTSMQAIPPIAVVADTTIISRAPSRLLAAGVGDIVSNQTAVLDWRLDGQKADYSEYAAALSEMAAQLVEDGIEKVASGTEEGVRLVVKALISSGVAMSIAGTSRPASGGEHKFSHWLDANSDNPALHGEQCGLGSIVTMYLHGGDWEKIRDTLKIVNAPINSKGLGMDDGMVLSAFINSKEIRPQRTTILDKTEPKAIEEAALATGVIG